MSVIINRFIKDPDAQLDYPIDWGPWLNDRPGDTIATSAWSVPSGLEKVGEAHDGTSTAVWIKGGTDGSTYELVNRVTTSSVPPRIEERSIRIVVRG